MRENTLKLLPNGDYSAFATGVPVLRWFVGRASPQFRAVPKEFWIGLALGPFVSESFWSRRGGSPPGSKCWNLGEVVLRTDVPGKYRSAKWARGEDSPCYASFLGGPGREWSEELDEARLS